ncbi:cytochrome C oxidase subunit IV family protein [Devosia riboflavina]
MSVQVRHHPGINLSHARPEDERHTEVTVFGFWTFLMNDAILFALLFATYATMVNRTAGGPTGPELFDIGNAFVETLVLLVSSFTFGMGAVALKEGRERAVRLWLGVTLVLGLSFIGLELREFASLIGQGATAQTSGFLCKLFRPALNAWTARAGRLHLDRGDAGAGLDIWPQSAGALAPPQARPLLAFSGSGVDCDLYNCLSAGGGIMSGPWEGDYRGHVVAQPSSDAQSETRSYIWGLGLAVGLTAIAFGFAVFKILAGPALLAAIGILALIQIAVQFRFFLHIDLSRSKREDLQLILFTGLLILIMVGGSLWIMASLDQRMMG